MDYWEEILDSDGDEALTQAVSSLEVLKAMLDGAWSSLVRWKLSSPMAGSGTRSSLRSILIQVTL